MIGRDHLDSGSVASPYRETEGMRDGSDAVADWPILNALLNTASGASWVSVHHGGGVGMGLSIHAGIAVVAIAMAHIAMVHSANMDLYLGVAQSTIAVANLTLAFIEAIDAAANHLHFSFYATAFAFAEG